MIPPCSLGTEPGQLSPDLKSSSRDAFPARSHGHRQTDRTSSCWGKILELKGAASCRQGRVGEFPSALHVPLAHGSCSPLVPLAWCVEAPRPATVPAISFYFQLSRANIWHAGAWSHSHPYSTHASFSPCRERPATAQLLAIATECSSPLQAW